jgi:phage-related protein
MSTPPRIRRVRFYRSPNGREVAKDEFFELAEEGQAALHELFTRFENGAERHSEIKSVGDDLMEFRVRVGNNHYRAYYFADGPRYVIVLMCIYKNQNKMSPQDKDTCKERRRNWLASASAS